MKFKHLFAGVVVISCVVGCNTDQNPVTPQKMQEIRQKEQSERKNFSPNMAPPAAKTGN